MNGFIRVDSTPGTGNAFHFIIPLRPGSEESLRQTRLFTPSHAVQHTDVQRVLLVEDNELNQEVAAEMLRMMGADPTIAANGAEAVALCRENRFDLILMDIQMPVMDGLEATRQIRAGSGLSGANVPIIAMTSGAASSDREKSLAAGMNDHITKPVDYAELNETVRLWAGRA